MKVCCPCGGHAPTLKDDLPLITQLHQKFSYTTSNIDGFSLGGSVISWVLTRGLQGVQCLRVDPRNGREEDWTQGGTSMWGSTSCTWRQTAFPLYKILTLQNGNCHPPHQIVQAPRKIAKVSALDKLKLKRWKQRDCKASLPYLSKSISSTFVERHFFDFCQQESLPYLSTLISQFQNIFSSTASAKQIWIYCIVILVHSLGAILCVSDFDMCLHAACTDFVQFVHFLHNVCNNYCVWSAVYAADVWSDDLLGIQQHVRLVP